MMIDFKPLTWDDIDAVLPYFEGRRADVCDNTAGAIFQWSHAYHSQWAIIEDCFCLRVSYPLEGSCYGFPIGRGNTAAVLNQYLADARLRNEPLRLCVLTESAVKLVEQIFSNRVTAVERRDWADYIYPAKNFLSYSGKSLHSQRNHVNSFYRAYPNAVALPITDELVAPCMSFLDEYAKEHPNMSAIESNELLGARQLICHRSRLKLSSLALVVDDKIAALSLGELVDDTLFVHVEKATSKFRGAYPAMAQAFVCANPKSLWVNREDDAGDEGLRYSKQNYRPCELRAKFLVTVDACR